jgi:MFS family permease
MKTVTALIATTLTLVVLTTKSIALSNRRRQSGSIGAIKLVESDKLISRSRMANLRAIRSHSSQVAPLNSVAASYESEHAMRQASDKALFFKLSSWMFSIAYISIITSIMSLPVCLSAMYADSAFYGINTSKSFLSSIIALATVATCVGKFVLGPPTDFYGGDLTLKATMFLVAAFLFACAGSGTVQLFGVLWIVISFVYASAWGAIGKLVRERFPSSQWGQQLGFVAAASRMGSMSSSMVYGQVLKRTMTTATASATAAAVTGAVKGTATIAARPAGSWRAIFLLAGSIQSLMLIVYWILGEKIKSVTVNKGNTAPVSASTKSSQAKHDKNKTGSEKSESVPEVLLRVSKERKFWLMLTGKCTLMTVGQFISFIPLYLTTGHGLGAADSAAVSASFAVSVNSTLTAALYSLKFDCFVSYTAIS